MRYKLNKNKFFQVISEGTVYVKILRLLEYLMCQNITKIGSIFQNSQHGSILRLNNWKTVNHTDLKVV